MFRTIMVPMMALTPIAVCLAGCEGKPEIVYHGYLAAIADHDLERAMSYIADDFVIESKDEGFRAGRDAMRSMLEWDLAANTTIEIEELEVAGDTIKVRIHENNDFLDLTGMGPYRIVNEYIVEGERFVYQGFRMLEGETDIHAGVAACVTWAREQHPEILEEIYPNGEVVYTGESVKQWVALLQAWYDAGAPKPEDGADAEADGKSSE